MITTTQVEVDHLTNWGPAEWWLHLAGAAAIPFVLAVVGGIALAVVLLVSERVDYPGFVEVGLAILLVVAGAIGVAGGLVWYGQALYDVLRHATSWNRSFLWMILVVVAIVAVVWFIAAQVDLPEGEALAVAGVGAGVPAIVAWVADVLHRVAAWIPMAFGTFMALLIVGLVYLGVNAMQQPRRI